MSSPRTSSPPLELPAALLSVRAEKGRDAALVEAFRQACGARPGVHWLEEGLCAVLPDAADPAVFDTAIALARELLAAAPAGGGGSTLAALILPGRARVGSEVVSPVADPLVEDLARKPPACSPGRLYLTSYAAARLEVPRRQAKAGTYNGPSGSRVPLLEVLGDELQPVSWRNAHLLRRRHPYTPRPQLDAALADAPPVVRVTGPPGCGKGRAVHHALAARRTAALWTSCRPSRQRGPGLAAQLLARLAAEANGDGGRIAGLGKVPGLGPQDLDPQRLLAAPELPAGLADPEVLDPLLARWIGDRTVVCDDLEGATADDLDLVARLVTAAGGGASFRLLLLARTGAAWPEALRSLPEVRVPPMAAAEMAATAAHAFAGLSLPVAVQGRLIEHAGGLPFALEEGLVALVHQRWIRQVYGSFFFSGGDELPYFPSDRLVQHAEAEARRLGSAEPLRLLALADTPLPAAEVLAAAEAARLPADPGWVAPFLASGWVAHAESPWGPGIAIPFPALARSLAAGLSPEQARRLRQYLGRALAPLAPRGAWQRYRLLEGAAEATAALLEVAVDETPAEELAAALKAELDRHRERRGSPEIELELLWQWLPLCRRLGRLHDCAADVDRARELAAGEARRYLALSGLKSEIEEEGGDLGAAEATIREVLKRQGAQDAAGALLVLRLSRLLIRQDRHEEARQLLEQVEPILKASGAPALRASCLFYLGNVALHQNRLDDALSLHRRALAIRRELTQPKIVGASLSALGRVTLILGRYTEALEFYREADEVLSGCGDDQEASFALLGIGRVLGRLGDFAAASAPLRKALALREEGDDVVGQAIARLAVAENHLHIEHPAAALREARRAHFDLRLLPGSPATLGDAEHLVGRIVLLQRRPEDAAEHFAAAAEIHRRFGAEELLAFDLARWIEAAVLLSRPEDVRRLSEEVAKLLARCPHAEQREILDFHLYQGFSELGDEAAARSHLRRSYRELLRKAEFLPRDLRHRFLFQIPEHQELLAAATHEGISWPDLPVEGQRRDAADRPPTA
jgi:tetratricopeptide (TPR) repeat protein